MRFFLTGDIQHPGVIDVEAATPEEAVEKAEAGLFIVHDEQANLLAFQWDGGDITSDNEGVTA